MNAAASVRFDGVTPYLYYEDAGAALEWLSTVFGFRETVRYVDAEGVVQEAEMAVGDATIAMTGMGSGHWARQGTSGPVGQLVIVHVDDVDAHHRRAVAGAVAEPPEDMPYGARVYIARDPGGNSWSFWQHLRDEVILPDGWREIRARA